MPISCVDANKPLEHTQWGSSCTGLRNERLPCCKNPAFPRPGAVSGRRGFRLQKNEVRQFETREAIPANDDSFKPLLTRRDARAALGLAGPLIIQLAFDSLESISQRFLTDAFGIPRGCQPFNCLFAQISLIVSPHITRERERKKGGSNHCTDEEREKDKESPPPLSLERTSIPPAILRMAVAGKHLRETKRHNRSRARGLGRCACCSAETEFAQLLHPIRPVGRANGERGVWSAQRAACLVPQPFTSINSTYNVLLNLLSLHGVCLLRMRG